MDEPRAQRTLVKSPPELWAEVSDVDALAGHLGEFGEIRITRTEPETTVAWEGDRACGTVELEPTAWGTKVTLTALVADAPEPAAAPEPEPEPAPAAESRPEPAPDPDPEPEVAAAPAPRRGFFARLFGRRIAEVPDQAGSAPIAATVEMAAVEAETAPESPERDDPEPPAPAVAAREPLSPDRAEEILGAVLDDLGSAHHRPFSR